MNSLRPLSAAILKHHANATVISQIRKSLGGHFSRSFYVAASACDSSPSTAAQRRLLQANATTNTSLRSPISPVTTSPSAAAKTFSPYRFFHTTPRQLQEATATDAVDATAESGDINDDEPHPTEIDYDFTPAPPLSEDSMKKVNGLFEQILHLDMVEVHLLTMVVNEQLGIKWNQVQAAGAGPIGGGGADAAAPAEEEAEEKLLKDLKLVGFDAKAKIKVIKEVRSIAGLGLKEAKELVESAPKIIQKELKPEKAEELKAQLEAVGAQIEIA